MGSKGNAFWGPIYLLYLFGAYMIIYIIYIPIIYVPVPCWGFLGTLLLICRLFFGYNIVTTLFWFIVSFCHSVCFVTHRHIANQKSPNSKGLVRNFSTWLSVKQSSSTLIRSKSKKNDKNLSIPELSWMAPYKHQLNIRDSVATGARRSRSMSSTAESAMTEEGSLDTKVRVGSSKIGCKVNAVYTR